jgi:hypothetical protein
MMKGLTGSLTESTRNQEGLMKSQGSLATLVDFLEFPVASKEDSSKTLDYCLPSNNSSGNLVNFKRYTERIRENCTQIGE